MTPSIARYGSWPSPISVGMAVSGFVQLSSPARDGEDTYWIESRPAEEGREVIVRRSPDGSLEDVSPPGVNVRSRVHEYGGGAYAVSQGAVIYSDFSDGRLYRVDQPGAPARAITPEKAMRYGDLHWDVRRGRILCVREDHSTGSDPTQPVNALLSLPADGWGEPLVLAEGNDFYAAPRLSPDGRSLVWLTWNHPDMPWDSTELWLGELDGEGRPTNARRVAGGPGESVAEPVWSTDGRLHFVSDRTGWWNLYRLEGDDAEPVAPMDAEFTSPAWNLGQASYAFLADGSILTSYRQGGRDHLARIAPGSGRAGRFEQPFTEIDDLWATGSDAILVASAPDRPNAIVRFDPATGAIETLHEGGAIEVDPAYLSRPRPITFPTGDGGVAHALYYPPTNPDVQAPATESPPLLVMTHGGPTAAAWTGFNPRTQFYTSRGFAFLDVDYGGSTGYGRAYRQRLEGRWGEVDVDDAIAATRYVCEQGLADPGRTAIRGGSAGGYTTLAALAFRDVFQAGASHFGVADLTTFVHGTHKFESRYLERLVGPYPERADLYRERSPIFAVDQLSSPLLVTQGLDDHVVPPEQAEQIVAALRRKGVPHAYLAFEGEDHGYRGEHAIRRSMEAELSFYSQIFGFPLADAFEPVTIEGLDAA